MEGRYKRLKVAKKSIARRNVSFRAPGAGARRRATYRSQYRPRRYSARRRYLSNLTPMGVLGIETKYYDTVRAGAAVPASNDAGGGQLPPTATEMIHTMIVGDGPQNRDGHKILLKRIQIHGVLSFVGATTVGVYGFANPTVLVALVRDNQCNGTLVNSNLIYDNFTGSAAGNAIVFRDMSTSQRFTVLYARRFSFPPHQITTNGTNPPGFTYSHPQEIKFDIDISLNDTVIFETNAGSTSDVANLKNYNYIPVFLSDYGGVTVTYACRVRFMG